MLDKVFLFHLTHKRCVVWRRNRVSFGVETLCQLALGDCLIWRRDFVPVGAQDWPLAFFSLNERFHGHLAYAVLRCSSHLK